MLFIIVHASPEVSNCNFVMDNLRNLQKYVCLCLWARKALQDSKLTWYDQNV